MLLGGKSKEISSVALLSSLFHKTRISESRHLACMLLTAQSLSSSTSGYSAGMAPFDPPSPPLLMTMTCTNLLYSREAPASWPSTTSTPPSTSPPTSSWPRCATACFPSLPKEAKKADEGELASSGKSVEHEVSLENSDEKTVKLEETLVQIYITNMQNRNISYKQSFI